MFSENYTRSRALNMHNRCRRVAPHGLPIYMEKVEELRTFPVSADAPGATA